MMRSPKKKKKKKKKKPKKKMSNVTLNFLNHESGEIRRKVVPFSDLCVRLLEEISHDYFGAGKQWLGAKLDDNRVVALNHDQVVHMLAANESPRPLYVLCANAKIAGASDMLHDTYASAVAASSSSSSQASSSSCSSEKKPQGRIRVPRVRVAHHVCVQIEYMQQRYKRATQVRCLRSLIRMGANLDLALDELKQLDKQGILAKDENRRRYDPLHFPLPFARKVNELKTMELGDEDAIVEALMRSGGSATEATLFLIERSATPKSDVSIVNAKMTALGASIVASPVGGAASARQPITAREQRQQDVDAVSSMLPDFILAGVAHLEALGYSDRRRIVHHLCACGGDTLEAAERLRIEAEQRQAERRIAEQRRREEMHRADEQRKLEFKQSFADSLPNHIVDALSVLSGMGYEDTMKNIILLDKHKGNVEKVVEELVHDAAVKIRPSRPGQRWTLSNFFNE
jgi:hypothetical protein